MQETWVLSLGLEDPLEKGKAPVFWPGEIHGLYSSWDRKELDTTEQVSHSLEGLMLKLKLQYFGHLMQRTDSLEKSLMLGKVLEGGRRRG